MLRRIVRTSLSTWLIVAAATVGRAESLLLCGMTEVFEVDVAAASTGPVVKLWSWRAADRAELPEAIRSRFGTTDECKPIDGGRKVLITASSGGCALVERPSGRVLWHAVVGNAHSIELLPNDRVVVAGSVHAAGNRLTVFDLKRSETPLFETPLVSGHGVVWDAGRERLWALGLDELQRYRLEAWNTDKPSLTLEAKFALPSSGGHDLTAVPGGDDLFVTTNTQVLLFDRREKTFREHPELGKQTKVKSVQVHPRSGRLVFTQGTDAAWWNDRIGFLQPAATLELPQERLYKARWLE
jgi:hypothetical protein